MLFKRRIPLHPVRRLTTFLAPRKGMARGWTYVFRRVMRLRGTPDAIAAGFACGVLVSFTPLIGLHFLIAAAFAWVVRGNLIASAFGTFVGNPITFPFFWLGSYNAGSFVLGRALVDRSPVHFSLSELLSDPWTLLEPLIAPMTIGAVLLGGPTAVAVFYLVRAFVRAYRARRARRAEKRARARTGQSPGAAAA